MDILTKIWETYAEFARDLPAPVYSFLLRANIMLLFPAIIAYLGFSRGGWRSQKLQMLLIIAGLLVGLSLPLGRMVYSNGFRPWMVIILITGLFYLPGTVAFLCEPRRGHQELLRKRILIALAVLFVINLVWN
ncbi:hypothetical protein P4B35_10150 [Pontiellaceae bacterium B12227]|nr:hypothetical protein [Pontiellaceae bacterium B12227]